MGKFEKGHTKKGGKELGTPNKLTKTVRDLIENTFNEMNQDPTKPYSLIEWGKQNPKDFYLIAAKLIPIQVGVSGQLGITWEEVKTYDPDEKTNEGD